MGPLVYHNLLPHPACPRLAIESVEAKVSRSGTIVDFSFAVTGNVDDLEWTGAAGERTEGLWRSTCFEIFLKPKGDSRYWEINITPSEAWAAYGFERYRDGMGEALGPPRGLACMVAEGIIDLHGWFDLVDAEPLHPFSTWQIGMAAVIAHESGHKSYWALRHPPGPPDFHHPDCFALELASPRSS